MSTALQPGPRVAGRRNVALAGMVLAVAMTTIDQTIVALSAPSIADNLDLTSNELHWSINAYILTTAAFFALGGRLADIYGYRRMVLVGIAGFAVASLLCGFTPTGSIAGTWLVTARAAEGFFGALMYPAALGIVAESFRDRERGRAMALFFGISGGLTAIGPIAGGYLTLWTWRAIFWINIPIALIAVVVIVVAKIPSGGRPASIDWRGAILAAAGMGALVLGLQQAGIWGWGSPVTWAVIVAGLAVLAIFVVVERRTESPLVRLEVLHDRGFAISTLAILVTAFAFVPLFFFLSVYGEVSLRLSADNTGLLLLKFFIGFFVASRIGGKLFDQRGAKHVYAIAGIIGAVGFYWLSTTLTQLDQGSGFFNGQFWPIALAGAGIGFMLSAASADMVNRSINSSYGEVTGLGQTVRNFGAAIGLAVFTSLLTTLLTTKLTASFASFGGSAKDARSAVEQITGAVSGSRDESKLPPDIRDHVIAAIRGDYAAAAQWVFYCMAGAMALLLLLSFLYPARAASRQSSTDATGREGHDSADEMRESA